MKAELYSLEGISSIDWPETQDGNYARRYLLPFVELGPQEFIRNVLRTELMVANVDEIILPITVTDFHRDNAYVCSPYSHYISYGGFEEIRHLKNPAAEVAIKLLLVPLAWYFRQSDFDRVVYVNNWLLSTNLYPRVTSTQIQILTEVLPHWFPDRAIVFRSVDRFSNPILYNTLHDCGYEMVLSRQVWYQDPRLAQHKKQFKVDMSVLRRSGYEVVDGQHFSSHDLERALDLYDMLYLRKYSRYNPQFTEVFLQMSKDRELLRFKGLRRDGRLNGVMGYYVRNGFMTQPVFGYDTGLPQKDGLYQMLSLLTLREGLMHGLQVHASAGVGKFKKLRSGKPVIEYNAVYHRHLASGRRMPWKIMKKLSSLAIPIFQKNDL